MKRFITVNERNVASLIGKINNFFKKSTQLDKGLRSKIIGQEEIEFMGSIHKRNVYGSEEIYYKPYKGSCGWHHIRKEILETKKLNDPYNTRVKSEVYLTISSPHELSCVPISIGTKIGIFGDTLIVIDPYNKYTRMSRNLRTHTFKHQNYSVDYREVILDHFLDNLSNDIYNQEYDWSMLDWSDQHFLKDKWNSLHDEISSKVKCAIMMEVPADLATYDINDEFKFEINVNSFIEEGTTNDNWSFILDGIRTQNLNRIVAILLKDEIDKILKEEEDSQIEDEDYDYNEW